uniref:Uncharacterized protein n=1 Tax=Quercus lobata TaxID=97700 RepID=A0A7N2M4X0_QUELO
MTRASRIILNTFDDLEAPILCHIAPLFLNIYTIGPLNALVKTQIGDDVVLQCLSSSSNLLKPDHNCITWLDSQPLRSVVFVSFGSIARVTRGVKGDDMIPAELEEATKERGFVVDWAPQEDVLAHPAMGGFFTHSGWNSVVESIDAGVPMICWPLFGDHQLNSRWVSEGWRIGLEMKDTCDRSTIEMMIKTLRKHRREEIIYSMDQFSKLAHDSVSPSGSSYKNLEKLIEDLRRI